MLTLLVLVLLVNERELDRDEVLGLERLLAHWAEHGLVRPLQFGLLVVRGQVGHPERGEGALAAAAAAPAGAGDAAAAGG